MEQHLSLYRIFYTVANTGNISQAAKQLYNSQPAISKSISRLEESLGVTLFSRSSRGVTLTEEGRILYEHIRIAFEAIDSGEEKVRRMNDLDIGSLHIGASNTLCKFILIPYLSSFIEKYPNIKIYISCQSSNQTLELLDSGKIDIGLVAHPGTLKGLDFYSLGTIQDIFVASPAYLEHLELSAEELSTGPKLFEKATLMLLDKHNMTRQYIDDYMTANHLPMNNTIVATSMELLIEFAKIGLGVGCVIKEFVKKELEENKLQEIPLDIPIHRREIGFIYEKKRQQEKALQHFIDFYKSTKENS
ncbi:MAG: LysR family transcriptional regulator [Clostridia bacterium]|nr:LysR family transcriptional regulator [Lachnospiraceae bacterium]NCB99171.1 LysR family transcriptional regulator [Clostridia bacterium]NCD02220.1 LysR family transcriptional regulator [Clostridia bacterium]